MKELQSKIQAQLNKMCDTGKLFRSEVTGQKVWEIYMKSFGDDPMFRDPESSVHNCNHCNNFIRRYGNIVAVDSNNKLMSLFDFDIDGEYEQTVKDLSKLLTSSTISNVFFETFDELNSLPYEVCKKSHKLFRLGIDKNHKRYTKQEAEMYKNSPVKENDIVTFDHLYLDLPAQFVDMSGNSIESIMATKFREPKEVFKRAMDEISLDTLNLVKDLINQGSLLDGQTHLYKVEEFIPMKKEYDKLGANVKDNWAWVKSYKLPFAKFKNELIGTFCSELSEGKELNEACKTWNYRVDPINYMKASAPITKKQIQEAQKFVEENGYVESFDRRFATIDDIKASEILHLNTGDGKIKNASIFDNVKSTSTRHKRSEFDKVEEVSIEKFMKDILPTCSSVEAFLLNSHIGNMVSMTTANNKESKPIFKWTNNYSWTYNGNIAGKSQIKEEVKSKGGNVDGVLRASMIWNESTQDNSDLDIWCKQPDGQKIGYSQGYRKDSGGKFTSLGGQLDLDNTSPSGKLAVENIYFNSLKSLRNGVYSFWVNQYSEYNSKGFKFEIEFDGEIYSYEYNKPLRWRDDVKIADVTFKDGEFTIKHYLEPADNSYHTKEIYGLETNQFHKVNLVCLSPNHWNEQSIGNKHYMFMLDGCKTPSSIRSFHAENLIPELAQHRKTLEILGNTTMIEPKDEQLSGLGFNATVREDLVLKLYGTFKRIIKIKF